MMFLEIKEIWNVWKSEMREWQKKDTELYAIFMHQSDFLTGGDISGFPFN